MNREEFHLSDTNIRLLDPFKTNSDFWEGRENPLFLRVILAARAYAECAIGRESALSRSFRVGAGFVFSAEDAPFNLSLGNALGLKESPNASAESAIQS
jgi:hypothetical protein